MNKIPIGLKRVATLCILRNKDKFLLLRRLKEPNKDHFTAVGGKLDPFESPLNSAIGETFEETGIKVHTMKYCGILTETSPIKYIGQATYLSQILILLNHQMVMKEL